MTDSEWVEQIVIENYDRVLRLAYRRAQRYRIPNPDAWAADMTQQVFLTMLQQMQEKQLRQHENITAWLMKTLYCTIGSEWQKHSNREILVADVSVLRQAPSSELTICEPFPPGLSAEECSLLYRCHCLGFPRKTVADSLGISLGACQMRLERAEAHFRILYEAQRKEHNKVDASTEFDGFRQSQGSMFQKGGARNA